MVDPRIIERMQALVDRDELEPALEVFFREVVKMPEYELKDYRQLPMWQERIKLAPTIPRELMSSGSYKFHAQKFSALQLPVLFLLGEKSPRYFHDATRTANAAIQNGQIVELPGELHIAMDTNPTLFENEVMKFLLGNKE
jgi:pimeloyl-ACP methyl ester carboxylesterase